MPPAPTSSRKAISIWLLAMAGTIFLMVIIGGITRLTESGLSITEWNLFKGTFPPFSESGWNELFLKYQESPQFKIVNHQMTLADFKNIFWWEYIHRFWGRALGVFFALPFLYFLFTRALSFSLFWKLLIAFVLGGAQGFLGWYMVQSGLVDVPQVSGYRLTAHLLLATALMAYVLWLGLDLWPGKKPGSRRSFPLFFAAAAVTGLVFLQIGLGGLMAGTKAGLIYPTFPTMNGQWIPTGLFAMEPVWRNLFENPAVIQLLHRLGAVTVTLSIFVFWLFAEPEKESSTWRQRLLHLLPIIVLLQFVLGIVTVLHCIGSVPVFLGVLHQGTGVFLLLVSVAVTHQLRPRAGED